MLYTQYIYIYTCDQTHRKASSASVFGELSFASGHLDVK